jgi:ADP-ribosyl-[dinitrogen reductase] hydrolase
MRARLARTTTTTTTPKRAHLPPLPPPHQHHTTAARPSPPMTMGMAASAPRAGAAGVCQASAAPLSTSAALNVTSASSSLPLPPLAVVRDRAAGALWAALAADSLAMPVHWYYNPMDIQRHFPGGVGGNFPYGPDGSDADDGGGGDAKTSKTGANGGGGGDEKSDRRWYAAPRPAQHPSSIMNLHSTGGQGRGGQQGSIIGDVINHGKKQYWGQPGVHYHNCLRAGDNTLNALCLRLTARVVAEEAKAGGAYGGEGSASIGAGGHARRWLASYVSFMTTPGSHEDTYAESFHRAWFGNYARGVAPEKCSRGTRGHDDSQIGGFVMLPPVALASAWGAAQRASSPPSAASSSSSASPEAVRAAAERAAAEASVAHVRLTHDSPKLEAVAARYGALLARVALAPVVATNDAASPSAGAASSLPSSLLASASSTATALLKQEAAREALEGVPSASIRSLDVAELAEKSDRGLETGYDDVRVLHRVTGPACYIESSWPAVLYLSARHADPTAPAKGVKRGLEANANAGGENCHRGAALGALLGCAAGEATGVPKAMREGRGGLREGPAIRREVDAFLDAAIGKV